MHIAALLKHQFTASSLWRLLHMLPVAAMLAWAIVGLDDLIVQLLGPAMLTVSLFGILMPEPTIFTAYGIPRKHALKAVTWVAVPAVLIAAAVGLYVRPDWVGLLGAFGAALTGCAMGSRYLPQVEPSERTGGRTGELDNRSLLYEVIWKPHLVWAVAIACALNATYFLTSFIDQAGLRIALAGLPPLLWYVAHASVTADSPGPQHTAAYGIPRRTWTAHILGAAAVSALIFAVLAYVVNLLVAGFIDIPRLPIAAIAVAAVGGLAVITAGAGGRIRFVALPIVLAFLMHFALGDLFEMHAEPNTTLAIAALIIAAVTFVFGAALLALYASGRIDLKPTKDAFAGA